MKLNIKVLPAANGDCLLIKVNEKNKYTNILIDGGKGVRCYRELALDFTKLSKCCEFVDLLVLTHIDDDHISGVLKLYSDNKIDKSIIKMFGIIQGPLFHIF